MYAHVQREFSVRKFESQKVVEDLRKSNVANAKRTLFLCAIK